MNSSNQVRRTVTNGSIKVKNYLLLKETAVAGSTRINSKNEEHSLKVIKTNSVVLKDVVLTKKETLVANIKQQIPMVTVICHRDLVEQHSKWQANLLETKNFG